MQVSTQLTPRHAVHSPAPGCEDRISRVAQPCIPLTSLNLLTSEMTTYKYEPLDANNKEIRILHLQPGAFEDPIHLSIEHIHFDPLPLDASQTTSREELQRIQKTLPGDWEVHRTLEDRLIYSRWENGELIHTSWTSPVVSFQDMVPESDTVTRQEATTGSYTHFEAVSYTWGSSSDPSEAKTFTVASAFTEIGTIAVGPNLWSMLRQLRGTNAARALWIDAICINQNDRSEKSRQFPRRGAIYTFAKRVIVWLGESADESTTALYTLEHIGKQVEFTHERYIIPAPDCTESRWFDTELSLPLLPATWTAIALLIQRPYFERHWIIQEVQAASSASVVRCGNTVVLWYYVRRALMRCRYEIAALLETSPSSRLPTRFAEKLCGTLKGYDLMALFALSSSRECSEPRDRVFAVMGLLPPQLSQSLQPLYSASVRDVYMHAFLATVRTTCRLGLLDCAIPESSLVSEATWIPDFTQSTFRRYSVDKNGLASSFSAARVIFQEPLEVHVHGILLGRIKAVSATVMGDAASDMLCLELGRFFVTEHGQLGCGPPSVAPGDEVCVALGSSNPILLRSTYPEGQSEMYRYIGPLYVHGLMEAQALLGALPFHWDLIIDRVGSKRGFLFLNQQTKEKVLEDPRLGPLPVDWEAVEKEDEANLEFYVQHYRNKITDEMINSDPRLVTEALKARGVDVTTITLI